MSRGKTLPKTLRNEGKAPPKGSIKSRVFALLDKNPLLSARMICQTLHLDYNYHKSYIWKLRSKWKNLPDVERGSKPSSYHGWRGWTYLPKRHDNALEQRSWVVAVMARVVGAGWIKSRARNRWVFWKDRLGRLQLFETGRVNLWVRKPATLGRAWQLICNGFVFTGVFTDLKELQVILNGYRWKGGIRQKSAHYIFETKQPLPKLTIDFFEKSNGIVIKVGDRTHPTSVEVIASYPDWAERNERALGDFMEIMTNFIEAVSPKTVLKKPERMNYVA